MENSGRAYGNALNAKLKASRTVVTVARDSVGIWIQERSLASADGKAERRFREPFGIASLEL